MVTDGDGSVEESGLAGGWGVYCSSKVAWTGSVGYLASGPLGATTSTQSDLETAI